MISLIVKKGEELLSALRVLLSKLLFWGINVCADFSRRYWNRIELAYKRGNWPVAVMLVVAPLAGIGFGWFTGLLDYLINAGLSFVFFFVNLAYFTVHTLLYIIFYIPSAAFDYGLRFFAGFWDGGIVSHFPDWLSNKLPNATDYVNALNILGLVNGVFYGSAAANSSAPGQFGLIADPPKVGDFFWRPITVDLNNPNGDVINPDPGTVENEPDPADIWYQPVIPGSGGSSGGGTGGSGDGSSGDSWDNIDWSDPSGWDCSGYSCTWVGDDGGIDLGGIHDRIDDATGGGAGNYDPISDGGTGTHIGGIIDLIGDGSWFGGF